MEDPQTAVQECLAVEVLDHPGAFGRVADDKPDAVVEPEEIEELEVDVDENEWDVADIDRDEFTSLHGVANASDRNEDVDGVMQPKDD